MTKVDQKIRLLQDLSYDLTDIGYRIKISNGSDLYTLHRLDFFKSPRNPNLYFNYFYDRDENLSKYIFMIIINPKYKNTSISEIPEVIEFIETLRSYGMNPRSNWSGDDWCCLKFDKWSKMTDSPLIEKFIQDDTEDDSDVMARYQIFEADATYAFHFCETTVTNMTDIKKLIKIYNETYIKNKDWDGGPVNKEFLNFYIDRYPYIRYRAHNPFRPNIILRISTPDYGTLFLGFSIKNKTCCYRNWGSIKPTKFSSVKNYDYRVVNEIENIAKKIMDNNMHIDDVIESYQLRIGEKLEWQWNETITEKKKSIKKRRRTIIKKISDMPYYWQPNSDSSRSPAPESHYKIGFKKLI